MDSIERLLEIMARLRAPDGCPWDREQTHDSIKNQLIEECYEVIDAIESNDPSHLKEELGDVLLHLVFHAQLAREEGHFDFDAVAKGICEKLIRRHPHVFGDTKAENASAVVKNWAEIKKIEKPERQSALDGVPRSLPALMRATETQKKAAHQGFDWPDTTGTLKKIREEIDELAADLHDKAKAEDELGDLLFALVNLARHLKIDAEASLAGAVNKFERRFRGIEERLKVEGRPMKGCSLAELDAIWDEVKKRERES